LFAFGVSAVVAAPASATTCSGNYSVGSQLLLVSTVTAEFAGEVLYATPKATNETVRTNAVNGLTNFLTWLEACPGSSTFTITPDASCAWSTPASFSDFLGQENYINVSDYEPIFEQQANTPLDLTDLGGLENDVLTLIDELTPCETY
jgi:hypothetical protein